MVQIILNCSQVYIQLLSCLYIPHGSDNTKDYLNNAADLQAPFISHMVQIIPFYLISIISTPNTLYPTWFR